MGRLSDLAGEEFQSYYSLIFKSPTFSLTVFVADFNPIIVLFLRRQLHTIILIFFNFNPIIVLFLR